MTSQEKTTLEELQRGAKADPEDGDLIADYHRRLRQTFPTKAKVCLGECKAWLAASSLEQDAAAAFLAEDLGSPFAFVAMTPASIDQAATLLPVFRHKRSGRELALFPGKAEAGFHRQTTVARGELFFAGAVPLLNFARLRRRIDDAELWIAAGEEYWPESLAKRPIAKKSRGRFPTDYFQDTADPVGLVEGVVARRSTLLQGRDPKAATCGRVLGFQPADTIFCGAAASTDEGFYLEDDSPSWDGWLLYVPKVAFAGPPEEAKAVLLSWVPAARQKIAGSGVALAPTRSIFWVEDPPQSSLILSIVAAEFAELWPTTRRPESGP